MCLTLAWAIDDARWVLGRAEYLDFLVWAAVGGVLVGFIGPKVGWGRWLTYLIGSIFAALIVPLLIGLVAAPERRVDRTTCSTSTADVGRPGLHRPRHPRPAGRRPQYLHYILDPRAARLGDLDVRVVRRVRPSPAAQRGRSSSASSCVANMAHHLRTTSSPYLVLFSLAVAASCSSGRTSSTSSPSGCGAGSATRPRISSVYLRGGTGLHRGRRRGVARPDARRRRPRRWPAPGTASRTACSACRGRSRASCRPAASTRPLGLDLRVERRRSSSQWNTDDALAITIQRDPTDKTDYYWRAVDLRPDRPQRLERRADVDRRSTSPADAPILDGLADDVRSRRAASSFTFTVTPDGFRGPTILSPATPIEVDQETPS